MAGVEEDDFWSPPTLKSVYRGFGDLKVLNENHIPTTVMDYTPGQSKMLWANEAWLTVNHMTMAEFRKIDLNRGNSEAAQNLHDTVYECCQVKKGLFSTTKTVYPKVPRVSSALRLVEPRAHAVAVP